MFPPQSCWRKWQAVVEIVSHLRFGHGKRKGVLAGYILHGFSIIENVKTEVLFAAT